MTKRPQDAPDDANAVNSEAAPAPVEPPGENGEIAALLRQAAGGASLGGRAAAGRSWGQRNSRNWPP